jgi:hypothetical protein
MKANVPPIPIKRKATIWSARRDVCSNCGYEQVQVCLCGMNRVCSKCGYGTAAYPCKCEEKK